MKGYIHLGLGKLITKSLCITPPGLFTFFLQFYNNYIPSGFKRKIHVRTKPERLI